MSRYILSGLVCFGLILSVVSQGWGQSDPDGWISLFDGKSLNGWRASENKDCFSVQNGAIVAHGRRSHLFYVGPIEGADFKEFELKVDVMTKPGSNGGIYFHTAYQETNWPRKGFEVQVNNSYHQDPRKTGSLYRLQDITTPPAKDDTWFTEHIMVRGNNVQIFINDHKVVDYTENTGNQPPRRRTGRKLAGGSGTFALQGHDPGSTIYYKNIRVKPLSSLELMKKGSWTNLFDGKSLAGWRQINGTADYHVENNTIVGSTKKASPNSFLCTTRSYTDFELEFEVKVDPRLNSGVQFRSHSMSEYRKGRVHGYQVEIATNANAGRIYDEARRGKWLDTEPAHPDSRKAFVPDQWNHYSVRCVGDSIGTWVNHIPVADFTDSLTYIGFIGLQVHSFGGDPPAQVRWRNLRIREITPAQRKPLKVVVVTGGHGFERDPFFAVFQGHDDIEFVEADQKDHSELFENIENWDYDVMVLYNMTQNISSKRRQNFIELLKRGVGLVAMHHNMGAFQEWPEYKNIIGTKYFLKDTEEKGVRYKKGSYKHGVDLTIQVKDGDHPITRGLGDFDHHDETYKDCWFAPDNRVLVTCAHPTSDESICWTRTYNWARVCGIQLGHGPKSYANKNYRQLVVRAIRWCGGRL